MGNALAVPQAPGHPLHSTDFVTIGSDSLGSAIEVTRVRCALLTEVGVGMLEGVASDCSRVLTWCHEVRDRHVRGIQRRVINWFNCIEMRN